MITDSTYKNSSDYYELIIIGAGPAGMTAAIYSLRAEIKTAIIEKDAPGGKIIKTGLIENYPGFKEISGPDLALNMFKQINSLGVNYLYGDVVEITKRDNIFFIKFADGKIKYASAVIVSTGMVERKFNIPGEKEYYGKGLSYCAICDGPLYKNKIVIVFGGGNSAFEEAFYLSTLASQVYLVHRNEKFRADQVAIDKVKNNDKIKMILNSIPLSFNGDGKKVTSVTIQNVLTNEKQNIEVDCIFPFIGFVPLTKFVENLNVIDPISKSILVDNNQKTTLDGLYAAGDACSKTFRQISTAIGDGTIAALSAIKYLED